MTDEELEEVYKLAEKLDDHSSKLYNKLDYDRCRELERAVKDGNEVIIVPTGTMDRLTEENKVLQKALELACQEIKSNENGRCGGLFYIQKIKADYGIEQMTYFNIFIKLAKQELEKEQKDET